mmetsp:Transcript_11227/g.27079  ORF Transcript_11227/g.27079 Transcript_11227/m.27079 type:complete len:383 (+) Transcript_11227:1613-2761(+)
MGSVRSDTFATVTAPPASRTSDSSMTLEVSSTVSRSVFAFGSVRDTSSAIVMTDSSTFCPCARSSTTARGTETATVDNDPSLPVPTAPALPLLICNTMRWSGVLELAAEPEPVSLTTVTFPVGVDVVTAPSEDFVASNTDSNAAATTAPSGESSRTVDGSAKSFFKVVELVVLVIESVVDDDVVEDTVVDDNVVDDNVVDEEVVEDDVEDVDVEENVVVLDVVAVVTVLVVLVTVVKLVVVDVTVAEAIVVDVTVDEAVVVDVTMVQVVVVDVTVAEAVVVDVTVAEVVVAEVVVPDVEVLVEEKVKVAVCEYEVVPGPGPVSSTKGPRGLKMAFCGNFSQISSPDRMIASMFTSYSTQDMFVPLVSPLGLTLRLNRAVGST